MILSKGWMLSLATTKECKFSQKQPQEVLCNNMFHEISQNSQKNTCARVSFLIKLQALGLYNYFYSVLKFFEGNFPIYLSLALLAWRRSVSRKYLTVSSSSPIWGLSMFSNSLGPSSFCLFLPLDSLFVLPGFFSGSKYEQNFHTRDYFKNSLLILSEFKQLNYLLFALMISGGIKVN